MAVKSTGLEEFSKEVRFPSSLLEPHGPFSVTQMKTRLMEIRGRVHYCNEEWQDRREPRRNTVCLGCCLQLEPGRTRLYITTIEINTIDSYMRTI